MVGFTTVLPILIFTSLDYMCYHGLPYVLPYVLPQMLYQSG